MKRIVAVLLTATALLALSSSSASAGDKVLDSHCSPTGDFCQGLFREDGRVKARLTTFSFSGRIQVCVQSPGNRTCKRFRLRSKSNGIFESSVTLSKHFNLKSKGRYSVSWRLSGAKVGKTLHFRKR